ncbi:unnamed protein product, partial [marine sediment metagenome]
DYRARFSCRSLDVARDILSYYFRETNWDSIPKLAHCF